MELWDAALWPLEHGALQLQMTSGTPYQATIDGADRCLTRLEHD